MKKKLLGLICVLSVVVGIISCKPDTVNGGQESMFVNVEMGMDYCVVYHKITKVMYVVSYGVCNRGTFTLLVDADGKPLLWDN